MPQPVRKNIKNEHPDLVKEAPFYTLLVDGNSLLFFSMVDTTINSRGVHYGGIFQFLLQLKMMLSRLPASYVYVTFDNEYSGYLRYKLYHLYKANRDKDYASYGESDYAKKYNENLRQMQSAIFSKKKGRNPETKSAKWEKFVDDNFDRERDTLMKYFEELYIRTYMDEVVEGDDIIAYYCKHKKPNEKIIIMSGDMDLMQLLDDYVAIYSLQKKVFITKNNFKDYFGYPFENLYIKKVFCGDTSDNIGNIKGLSENGFFKLMPEAKRKPITIEEVKERAVELINERKQEKKKPLQLHENIVNGVSNKEYDGDFYDINEKIINLKEPMMTDEAKEAIDNMMYVPMDIEGRSFQNLYRYILEDGIENLQGDTRFTSFFNPFKKLEEVEKKRYQEYVLSKK